MNWQVGQTVVLKKKKRNGFPYHLNVGDSLVVKGIETFSNEEFEKNNILIIQGNKRPNDSFKLHESFVYDIIEYREKVINDILFDG